ncbi:MAG: hypothetical protein K5864_05615 [Bacteroidales bacterium]|nr:hypothetical protein [Bacteroidales bacterium]
MDVGSDTCNHLKAIRHSIAEENGIALNQEPCYHEGPCRGTCPYCEQELQQLEEALSHRIRLGHIVTVAGIGVTLASCQGAANAPAEAVSPTPTIQETSNNFGGSILRDSCITPGINEDATEMEIFPSQYSEEVRTETNKENSEASAVHKRHADIDRIENERTTIDPNDMRQSTPLLKEEYTTLLRGEDGAVIERKGILRRRYYPLIIPKTPFEQYQEKQKSDPMPAITMEEESTNPMD